jgi:ABC-type lipoprotein release transport system permease subunit
MFYIIMQILGLVLVISISLVIAFLAYKFVSARIALSLGARNLVRQFRRNTLLGICIALGMCVLLVTTSFTNGLTDIIFNKVMVYITGQIRVAMDESTGRKTRVIRDEPRMIEIIKKNVDGITAIDGEVSAFARTIGNEKTGLAALVGMPEDSSFVKEMTFEEGSAKDLYVNDVFPGIAIYMSSAKELNVKLNDIITVRFDTIYGQPQSQKFKIVGLLPSQNLFMDVAAFVDRKVLKSLLNLNDQEVLGLDIRTTYPQDRDRIIKTANKLHDALTPGPASIMASLKSETGARGEVGIFGLKVDTGDKEFDKETASIQFVSGSIEALKKDKSGILLTESTAKLLGNRIGNKLAFNYVPKYSKEDVSRDLVVTGIIKDIPGETGSIAFANEDLFYETFFKNLPSVSAAPLKDNNLLKATVSEWKLLERSRDTDSSMKKRNMLNRDNWKGAVVDVETMYETASAIIDFQLALNLISVIAVFILFFVILIGVANTMRMSIRERTREIGTTRAIGMQSTDVAWVFIFEIVLLSVAACIVGIGLGAGLIALLSSLTIDLKDNPFSMFFLNKHPYFLPTVQAVYMTVGVIISISFLIAFFSARRAANMRAADALRHYE